MIGFQIDLSAANDAAEAIVADSRQLHAAVAGALDDASVSATKFLKKSVSKITGVSQRRLAVRVKMRRYQADESVTLWVGANPMPVHTVGTARENTRSVVAGRIVRRGAFWAQIGNYDPLRVFIREKSRHYKPQLYGGVAYGDGDGEDYSGWKSKFSQWGSFTHRFPLRLAVVNLYDAVDDAIYDLEDFVQDNFDKHFIRRLKYEVLVKGKGAKK
ncbi:MAG: hypothetical protein COA36_11735 [Desulfotalea sp.]|nr:MAG: hypothetical protein COA36_11735 [Desulfotalea sp.]